MTEEEKIQIIGLKRDLWIRLARNQFRRRIKIFGEPAKVCDGCREILICEGPISFQVCKDLDEMVELGLMKVKSPKSSFKAIRSKFLPVSTNCLAAYKFTKSNGNIYFKHRRAKK